MADYNDYLITIKSTSDDLVFTSKKADRNATYYTKLEEKNNKKDWTITIQGINYVKEIYRPCHLTLNLEVSMANMNAALVGFSDLISVFSNAQVTINAKRGAGKEVPIISNYYINSVEPSRLPNKMYKLKLEAYSADYQLKTDIFSECYLNSSLKSIIENHNKILNKNKFLIHEIEFSCDVKDGLQNINYEIGTGEYHVYHTPYAVQYNESFYDFIARLAHRYGEFLFFENGSLHLGVDPALINEDKSHDLDSDTTNYYKSITQTAIPDSLLGVFVNGSHYDYHNPDSLDQSQDFNYDLDYAEDMYMESYGMKDLNDVPNEEQTKKDAKKTHKEEFVDWRMFMDWVGLSRKCLTFLTSLRREDGFSAKEINDTWGAFAKLAVAWVDAGFTAKGKVDKTNSNYQEFLGKLKSGSYDANEQESDGIMRPFATNLLSENLLGTQQSAAHTEYTQAESERKSRESEVNQQKLGDAKKAFEQMIGKAQAMKKNLSDYKEKVIERKDDLTPLIKKLEEIIKAANETTVEVKNGNTISKKTCLELLKETDSSLNTNIGNRKSQGHPEENFEAEVTKNENKDQDTGTYETAILSILGCIALFEKSFLDEDGKNDYLSSACKLTDFCAVKDSELTSSDQKAAQRKAFAKTIQSDYVALKAILEDVKGKITSTNKNLDRMLKMAYYVTNAVKAEKDAYKKYLGLCLKIAQGNLFHKFLESVEKAEISSAKKRMSLEIDTSNYSRIPLLGEIVKFDSLNYLIIGVKSEYTWDSTKSVFTENLTLDLTPKNTLSPNENTDNFSQWIPPLSECRKTPKVGAMIATVTDHKDPRGMGRLRIKYKWQNKNSAQTPWIRMSTPFASKYGAGMFFNPQKDDEVLVDFYNGNIDRPIIVGALRNEKTERDYVTAYGAKGWHKRNDIAGLSGQMLQFKDGFMTFNDVVKFAPGVGSILAAFKPEWVSWVNWIQNAMQGGDGNDVRDTDFQKYMRGSISMHDRYNTWEITGNTTDRKVSIASNLGTVSIDALSGITISAPLGDLTISAKNIKMQASNNILIESGTQISRQRKIKKNKRGGGEMFYDATMDAIKDKTTVFKVDLSLLRLFVEAFIPPVEGTLLVKSNRYLKLEAGEEGSAEDFRNPFKMGKFSDAKKSIKSLFSPKSEVKELNAAIEAHAEDFEKLNKALNAIPTKVTSICKDRFQARETFMKAYNAVRNYNFNVNGNVQFKEFNNGNFWNGLDTVSEDEFNEYDINTINSKIKNIIEVENDDEFNALFDFNNTSQKLKKALESVGIPYIKSAPVAGQQDAYGEANRKKFLKLAIEAAHQGKVFATEVKNTLIEGWASDLITAMGNTERFTTYTLNEATKEVVQDKEFTKQTIEGYWQTLFGQIFDKTEEIRIGEGDAIKIPANRFGEEIYVNSIVRAFLCKFIKETECYRYDQRYAEATLNAVLTLGQMTPLVNVPSNDEIQNMLDKASQDITYFAVESAEQGADSLKKIDNNWQFFTKSCKFITDYWANPPMAKGLQIASNIVEGLSDLSGLTTIANDLDALVFGSTIESASVKSATHGGRVLISDHGVTAGLNSSGTFEKTSAKKIGSKKWK